MMWFLVALGAVCAAIVVWAVSGRAARDLSRLSEAVMSDDEREFRRRHREEHWD